MLLFDGLSFLISAGTLMLIRASFNAAPRRAPTSLREDIVEGLRYVLSHPVLRNISAMIALVNFMSITTTSQLVLFATRQVKASPTEVSMFYSAGSVGVIVLSLLASQLRKRWSFSAVVLGVTMLDGLLVLILAWTTSYWLAVSIWGVISGLRVLFNINTGSLRQAIVPNHLLGRVLSIAAVLSGSMLPFGTLLGGWAIEQTGNISLVYSVIGVFVFLIPLAFSFTPLGRADQYIPEKQAPKPAEVTGAAR